jgi:hypothetical protein
MRIKKLIKILKTYEEVLGNVKVCILQTSDDGKTTWDANISFVEPEDHMRTKETIVEIY